MNRVLAIALEHVVDDTAGAVEVRGRVGQAASDLCRHDLSVGLAGRPEEDPVRALVEGVTDAIHPFVRVMDVRRRFGHRAGREGQRPGNQDCRPLVQHGSLEVLAADANHVTGVI